MDRNLSLIHNKHFSQYDRTKFYKLIRSFIRFKYTDLKEPRFHHMWMKGWFYKPEDPTITVTTEDRFRQRCHLIHLNELIKYVIFVQRKDKLEKIINKINE